MVANFGDHLFLVVNAACKAADEAHLRAHLSDDCVIEPLPDRALIALQGPKAEAALAKLGADVAAMSFMDTGPRHVGGFDCFVSRSGYTGEDGFEISVPAEDAEALVTALLDDPDVLPIGLGARDSLRLEAGLCLYGHDIDTTTTPVEAALEWSVQKSRRNGGARAGGFPGADKILAQFDTGAARRRVGLRAEGRAPVREGAALCGRDLVRGDRQGHLGRFRSEPQCAGGDGLRAVLARRRRHHAVCRSARPAPAAEGRGHALRSQYLQTLEDFHDDALHLRPRMAPHRGRRRHHRRSRTTRSRSSATWCSSSCRRSAAALKKAEAAAVVESVKAASDVYAPITGEVVEVNDALVAEPALVNSDAGGKAWFFKLKIADKGELGGLMDEAA